MKRLAIVVVIVASICSAAFAHAGHDHVMGTVTKITADSIQVKTMHGDVKDVMIDSKTTYTKGSKKASVSDVTEGSRVVIDAHPMESMQNMLRAESVKIGASKKSNGGHSKGTKK